MSEFEIVTNGGAEPPVMLAVRAPGQVAAQADPSGAIVPRGARSGNPNFDPATGRFAGRGLRRGSLQVVAQTVQAAVGRSGVPAGVDPLVWERRLDAVRDAARQMEMLDVSSAQKFLQGRVVDVNAVDINAFLADVRMQRLADIADALDQQLHGGNAVKVVAPNRWITRSMADLSGPEVGQLLKRLEGRGWDASDINSKIVKKIKNPQLKASIQQLYGEGK